MASKYDKAREEITASIERVRALLAEGKTPEADTLSDETESLITTLPKREQKAWTLDLERVFTNRREPAPQTTDVDRVHEGTTTLSSEDWRSASPDVEEIAHATARAMAEGVRSHVSASEASWKLAEGMLKLRLRVLNQKDVPDFLVRDPRTRKAVSDVYEEAGRPFVVAEGKHPDYDSREALKSVIKAVQNRMSDVMVTYIRGLDNDPEEYATRFPMVQEKYPEATPSEAVWMYYETVGQALPRKGTLERRREAYEAAVAEGRDPDAPREKALEAGTPDERVTAGIKRMRADVKSLVPEDVASASDEVKEEVVKALNEIAKQIREIVPKAL
ncbi:hypothetical protein LHJ74_30755 [Streptomyces sp. N2-109]|uniref:RacO protein n=1 Tax=Streptomyces gossypii TaxID=2883101 RepID=A0ABT2K244_9ACTN|nr:hypothetical protein [Streptomyces gossypii]MCT2594237.1 hypothetical protein [Streptomyces gossypii]